MKSALLGICLLPIFQHNIVQCAEPPISAIFQCDAERIVVASQAGIKLHKKLDMKPLDACDSGASQLYGIAFDGEHCWTFGGNPAESAHIGLLELDPLRSRDVGFYLINQFTDVVTRLAFAPNTKRCLLTSLDGLAFIAPNPLNPNGHTQKTIALSGHVGGVTDAVWLSEDLVATSGRDAAIRVWDSHSGQLVRTLNQHTDQVLLLSVANGDRIRPLMASAGADRTIRFWEPTIGRMVRFFRLETGLPTCLAWLVDNKTIVVGTSTGNVLWIDVSTASVVRKQRVASDWVTAIIVASDGDIICGDSTGAIRMLSEASE